MGQKYRPAYTVVATASWHSMSRGHDGLFTYFRQVKSLPHSPFATFRTCFYIILRRTPLFSWIKKLG